MKKIVTTALGLVFAIGVFAGNAHAIKNDYRLPAGGHTGSEKFVAQNGVIKWRGACSYTDKNLAITPVAYNLMAYLQRVEEGKWITVGHSSLEATPTTKKFVREYKQPLEGEYRFLFKNFTKHDIDFWVDVKEAKQLEEKQELVQEKAPEATQEEKSQEKQPEVVQEPAQDEATLDAILGAALEEAAEETKAPEARKDESLELAKEEATSEELSPEAAQEEAVEEIKAPEAIEATRDVPSEQADNESAADGCEQYNIVPSENCLVQ